MILHDYETSSGRNVIKEYMDSLTIPEIVDGYSVREKMENGEFEKLNIKRWEKKYTKYIFTNTIAYFILSQTVTIFITCMQKAKKQNGKGRFKNNKKESKRIGKGIGKEIYIKI